MSEVSRRPSPFARYLRERRKALGLSQDELARRAGEGIIGSYIAKLERDDVETPPPARLRALARALEVPTSDFGRLIYHDAGERLPEAPRPVAPDPAAVAALAATLRARLPHTPEEQIEGAAYMLLALDWRSREEWEAKHGPSCALPPQVRGQPGRDGTGG